MDQDHGVCVIAANCRAGTDVHQVKKCSWQVIPIVIAAGIQAQEQNIYITASGRFIALEDIRARNGTSCGFIEEVEAEGEEGYGNRNARGKSSKAHGGNLTD